MGEWKKVRIGEFLTERQGRYKPDDNAIATYKRLDKIDFSETIHISQKPSKTDMIVVQPGDLVFPELTWQKGLLQYIREWNPLQQQSTILHIYSMILLLISSILNTLSKALRLSKP